MQGTPSAIAPLCVFRGKVARETLEFHVAGLVEDGQQVPLWLQDGDYCLAFEFEGVDASCKP